MLDSSPRRMRNGYITIYEMRGRGQVRDDVGGCNVPSFKLQVHLTKQQGKSCKL